MSYGSQRAHRHRTDRVPAEVAALSSGSRSSGQEEQEVIGGVSPLEPDHSAGLPAPRRWETRGSSRQRSSQAAGRPERA